VIVAGVGSKVTGISWAMAGGFAAWAVARVAAADRLRRAEASAVPLLSFTPQVAAAAPWAALTLSLTRRRGPAVTAALAAAALSLVVRPRGIPRPQPGASGPMLRVVSANLFFGRADADVIVARVRQASADVLFLQELTQEAVTRLKQAGLEDLMPHAQHDLRGSSRGSGIYSRFPLSEGPLVAPTHMAQPTALLKLPNGYVAELVCVHPVTPTLGRRGAVQWREELSVLPPPGKFPRIVAGDFNATLDHAVFRDVLRQGYADAALRTGNALTPTWGPPGRGAVLTLDHILVNRGCAVLGYSVHSLPGSDHRAIYAEIQLPELEPVAAAAPAQPGTS
jgi:endonuclease/exonuclease/phosphatase family metal-dependent hydrolase